MLDASEAMVIEKGLDKCFGGRIGGGQEDVTLARLKRPWHDGASKEFVRRDECVFAFASN